MTESEKITNLKKKKKTNRGMLIRVIISAVILCAAAVVPVIYQADKAGMLPGEQTGTDTGEATASADVTEPSDSSVETEGAPETEVSLPDFETEMAAMPQSSDLAAQGYQLSSSTFDSGKSAVAAVSSPIVFPEEYSLRGVYSEGLYSSIPVLRTYMGYLLYDDGGCIYALDAAGNIQAEGIDSLSLVYQRDNSGNPLFEADGRYYYINDGEGTLTQINFDPEFGAPLEYSYPKDYSENPAKLYRYYVDTEEVRIFSLWDIGLDITDYINRVIEVRGEEQLANERLPEYEKRVCSVRLWGYVDENGNEVIPAKYHYATAFNSDGCAFVGGHDGRMQMIDRDGKVILDAFGEAFNMEAEEQKRVVDGYYFPDTSGAESLGMFRFDHGLMRVTRKFYDYFSLDELVDTEDALVYSDGRVFAIPEGYKLRSYSDGVLLLQKGSLYGYMDYTGRWIVQPGSRSASPFYEGLAVVSDENGLFGMIDTSGNTVLPFVFTHITDCSEGVIAAYNIEHGWSIYNKMELAG